MYGKIIVGFQETDAGRDAVELGQILARANRAELLIVTAPREAGERLADLARSEGADLVVLGSTHRGALGRLIPGATVDRLLADAPCAVAVAPPGFGRSLELDGGWRPLGGDLEDVGLRVIGVGYDGTRAADEALAIATYLALSNGSALRVYSVARRYVVAPAADGARGHSPSSEAEALREQLHDAVAALPSEVRAQPIFMRGFAAQELIEAVRLGVDLLVLGSRGGRIRRTLHHSVTSAVLAEASCPVLISPTGVRAPIPA